MLTCLGRENQPTIADSDADDGLYPNEYIGGKTMDTTLQSIIEIALQQGIWAALYIYLFFRMLKENAERETQYQQMINHLSTNVVEGIADINDKLDDMARRLDNQST